MTRVVVSLASLLELASAIGCAPAAHAAATAPQAADPALASPEVDQAMAAVAPVKATPVRCRTAKDASSKQLAAAAAKREQGREKGEVMTCPAWADRRTA